MIRVRQCAVAAAAAVVALTATACTAPPGAPAWVTPSGPAAPGSTGPGPTGAASGEARSAGASAPGPAPASVAASPTAARRGPGPGRYAFPVTAGNLSYHPTHAGYPATDVFAACGSPVVAVTDGVVLEVSRRDNFVKGAPDGPNNGGLFVSVLGDDGVRYYGSHYQKVRDGVEAGVRVTAGEQLGELGRTGNASNVCHLHFALSPPCARTGDWRVRRGVVWPAPYLDAWRRGEPRSPADEVGAWQREHDCRA